LPNGSSLSEIVQIARYYSNSHLTFRIRLLLKKEEVPKSQLSSKAPVYLGWNSWVFSKNIQKDRDETSLEGSKILSLRQHSNAYGKDVKKCAS
jgi:predicted component of type VI protein secretion system